MCRYGLIGPNGSGKSTFLQCLAHREVPIPDHVDIFMLEEEAEPSDQLATDIVIALARKTVKRLEKEIDRLAENQELAEEALTALYDRLEDLDPETFEARASKLLCGLGFDQEMLKKPTKDMSGG